MSWKANISVCCFLLLSLPRSLNAQGAISGRVTDGTNPLWRVGVSIWYPTGGYTGVEAQTDSGGYYATPATLPAGTYVARARAGAGLYFIPQLYDGIPCPPLVGCDLASGDPIVVLDGQTTSGIDFALEPGGAISGTVTDAVTGQPLAGVDVHVSVVDGAYTCFGLTPASGQYT